jgi:hypothetical protein
MLHAVTVPCQRWVTVSLKANLHRTPDLCFCCKNRGLLFHPAELNVGANWNGDGTVDFDGFNRHVWRSALKEQSHNSFIAFTDLLSTLQS